MLHMQISYFLYISLEKYMRYFYFQLAKNKDQIMYILVFLKEGNIKITIKLL